MTVPATPRPRGSAVPARLRIVGWIVLTTLLGLLAVVLAVRSSLLAQVARQSNADVTQEANEFAEFVADGRDPETALPFTSTERLLTVYLSRQYPGDGEELVGYLPQEAEFIGLTRGNDADDRLPYDLPSRGGDLLRQLINAPETAGVLDTPAGEMRWGRVDIDSERPGDPGGSLVIAEFTRADRKAVDETVRLMALVAIGGLLLTAIIAYAVAGQILRPVRAVRRTAAEITERDLTRRIVVEGRDDVAALATTFNTMLDRLEDAFATQRRFVDDAGHELRTPITIIRGHLELMGDDPKERAATLALVGTEFARMDRIVGDLLVLAKAERPDFIKPETVDIAELTLEIDAKMQTLADRRWVLALVADGYAEVDAQRVTQAVLQYAQNAVQQTSDGAEVRLVSQFRGDKVIFSITDFGPGVPEADSAKIFERFARGSGTERDGHRGGAGLGLAIVRAIADGHGGSAFVHSLPGHGATFGIELPVVAGGPRLAEDGAGGRMSRILIAEDEPGIALFVEKGLRAAGFTTTTATDGHSALLLARAGGFELILLDIGLPELDGFTVLRRLRAEGVSTPVIILTARDSVADTVSGLEGGANDYVPKPFRFAELLARIRLRLREEPADGEPMLLRAFGLVLDLRTRRVEVDGRLKDLTTREFSLLEVFLRHPGQVLSREQLLSHVWGFDFDPASNVVDVYVRALRAKIGPERIETVRGAGYRLR